MANQEDIIQNTMFYEYKISSMWLAVVFNKQWKKYSIHLTRKYSYIKDGETKLGFNTIFLPLTAAAGLIGQLFPAYQFANQMEEENGIKQSRYLIN